MYRSFYPLLFGASREDGEEHEHSAPRSTSLYRSSLTLYRCRPDTPVRHLSRVKSLQYPKSQQMITRAYRDEKCGRTVWLFSKERGKMQQIDGHYCLLYFQSRGNIVSPRSSFDNLAHSIHCIKVQNRNIKILSVQNQTHGHTYTNWSFFHLTTIDFMYFFFTSM